MCGIPKILKCLPNCSAIFWLRNWLTQVRISVGPGCLKRNSLVFEPNFPNKQALVAITNFQTEEKPHDHIGLVDIVHAIGWSMMSSWNCLLLSQFMLLIRVFCFSSNENRKYFFKETHEIPNLFMVTLKKDNHSENCENFPSLWTSQSLCEKKICCDLSIIC